MNNVIQSIVSIGGFGYLNYYILNHLVDYNVGSRQDVSMQVLFFSSFDYVLFLLVSSFIANKILAGIITFLVALGVTVALPVAFTWLFTAINLYRGKTGSTDLNPAYLYDIMANDRERYIWFVFDLSNGKLLDKGYPAHVSSDHEDFSFILYRFRDDEIDDLKAIKTEEDLERFFQTYNVDVKTYINRDKNIRIVYF